MDNESAMACMIADSQTQKARTLMSAGFLFVCLE